MLKESCHASPHLGERDKNFCLAQVKRLAASCEEVGIKSKFILQEGMGHMYNPDPKVIGEIFDFFDKYLK